MRCSMNALSSELAVSALSNEKLCFSRFLMLFKLGAPKFFLNVDLSIAPCSPSPAFKPADIHASMLGEAKNEEMF